MTITDKQIEAALAVYISTWNLWGDIHAENVDECRRSAIRAALEAAERVKEPEAESIRKQAFDEAWEAVTALVRSGPLDEPANSERRGLALAANAIFPFTNRAFPS